MLKGAFWDLHVSVTGACKPCMWHRNSHSPLSRSRDWKWDWNDFTLLLLNHKYRKSPGAALRRHPHGCKALPVILPSSHSCSISTAGSSPLPTKIHPDIAHALFTLDLLPFPSAAFDLIRSHSLTICQLTTVKSTSPAQPRAPEFQTPVLPTELLNVAVAVTVKKISSSQPQPALPSMSITSGNDTTVQPVLQRGTWESPRNLPLLQLLSHLNPQILFYLLNASKHFLYACSPKLPSLFP